MKLKTKIAAAAVAVAAGLTLGLAGPAHASGSYFCDGDTTQSHCLNDWNGVSGGQVKMYLYGNTNEQFSHLFLTSMCGSGKVTSTCPFGDHAIDSSLIGAPIAAVEYNLYGECVDTGTGNGYAYLGTCPDLSGNGGSVGTVQVLGTNSSCNGIAEFYSVDRYWSDYYGVQVFLTGQGSNGGLVNYTQGGTCWRNLS